MASSPESRSVDEADEEEPSVKEQESTSEPEEQTELKLLALDC